jgi:type I restriction enzyme S subunit
MKFRWETEFKETDIGEIPRDWEVKKLGEVVYIKQGKDISTLKLKDWGYPVFGANGLIGYTDFYHYEEPQVLIACRGSTCGIINWSFPKSFVNNNAMALLPKSIDKKFLYFSMQLNFISGRIDETITGTGQPQITKEALEPFLIVFPPLPEQSRIAIVLSWFDDLIENKERQNEILEKTAMAIFKSWFIDFEPFRDGEFVYNEELGKEIPKGWEVVKTTRLIEYNPNIKMKKGEIYPFIEMKDVNINSFICEFTFKQFSGSGVRYYGGDTLMARITPSLEHGKTAFVWFISEKEKGFGSTEFFVLHQKEPYLKEFVYLLAKNDDFREAAINSMSGTSGRQRADINSLKDYIIPIPPSHILQSFHFLVEPLFEKIILNQKQIMTLKKVRDTFLPLLVFGKLRVEEI